MNGHDYYCDLSASHAADTCPRCKLIQRVRDDERRAVKVAVDTVLVRDIAHGGAA